MASAWHQEAEKRWLEIEGRRQSNLATDLAIDHWCVTFYKHFINMLIFYMFITYKSLYYSVYIFNTLTATFSCRRRPPSPAPPLTLALPSHRLRPRPRPGPGHRPCHCWVTISISIMIMMMMMMMMMRRFVFVIASDIVIQYSTLFSLVNIIHGCLTAFFDGWAFPFDI